MYSVYINHFNRNNVTIDTEELMFSVPITNNALINKPLVKSNEDAADNFSFFMDVNSPYYDSILPYKTEIRVEYDGDIIFWGRALPPSTSSVLHTKTIQCEGTYAYFNDTYYEGVQEKHRENMTVSDYLTKVINNHNNMVPEKQIFRGEVYITLPSTQEKYEPTAWTQTTSILSELTSNNGGHMRVRYTNGDAYLDWYKYYIRDLGDGVRPSVTVGKNIIDMSSDVSNRERFTRVIPIGATDKDGKTIYIDGYKYKDKDNVEHTYSGKAMPVSFVRNLYTSTQLTDEFHNWTDYRDAEDNYGIIYKTMSFADADTQEKLFDEVKKWIKESYFSIASSFTVKAIDMHIIDGNVPKILLGDCVDVTFLMTVNSTKQWITKKLVCKAVQYDLYNPENNSYTFGFPSDLLNAANRHKSSKKSASDNIGNRNKTVPKGTEDEDITWRKVWEMIGTRNGNAQYEGTNAAMSFYNNGEKSGTVKVYDPEDFKQGESPYDHKERWFDARIIGFISLTNTTLKVVCVSGDRGIFAYAVAGGGNNNYAVTHWYSKKKGYTYNGAEPLKYDEKSGEIYATDDQTPEGNKTITFEPTVLTGYGSAGEAKIGYDLTSQEPKWKIKLNYPIQYRDADGQTRIADGFVSAQDFSVEEIPSFKTKIGIFDIVIAGKVEAQTISADLAEVRKWLGDRITAGTFIRTATLNAQNINVSSTITAEDFLIETEVGGSTWRTHLGRSFYDAMMSESGGVVTLTLSRADGSASKTVNFNMASTRFFQDAVEAAYERGYEDGGGGGGGGDISFVITKCYVTTITSPQATDDDGNLHNCIKIKSLGSVSSLDKSIRVIFKVGETQYNYYFGINGN